ncbi:MAG TPA: cytochrome c [Steroidobacteraceae bacterium]|jgi:mono/diheme cytochrome c family protein|nr:cytochrome c [Steroidobacteraceae bacterium]
MSVVSWYAGLGRGRRRLLIAAAAAALLGAGTLVYLIGPAPMDFAGGRRVALASYSAGDPTGVPAALANESLVKKGEYLARAADCVECHTAKGGAEFAGGAPFVLPFGTLYSTNITPDPRTGIGAYTDAEFLRAVRRGVRRDGARLYPAMTFASYRFLSDADVLAIKAYLFSLAPVEAPGQPNTLGFPFNQRWAIGAWGMLFAPDRRFEPNAERSAEWNRGAYLAEALGHCGECHTPRNFAFALDNRRKFGGADTAGWRAYNISADRATGIGAWEDAAVLAYLHTGHAAGHGTAGGPMAEAIDAGLRHLTSGDLEALITYVRSVPATVERDSAPIVSQAASASHRDGTNADDRGKQIYAGACASCHGWSGESPLAAMATLTGARAVNDVNGRNVAQTIIHGSHRDALAGGLEMPAFGDAYSDSEIAAVTNYVTGRFGAQAARLGEMDVAQLREESGSP